MELLIIPLLLLILLTRVQVLTQHLNVTEYEEYATDNSNRHEKYPCNLYMSVDIQNGKIFKNGSILHDMVMYPPSLHFMYEPDPDAIKRDTFVGEDFALAHRRGCVCALKKCIRKCCHMNNILVGNACTPSIVDFEIEIYSDNETVISAGLDKFAFVFGDPCLVGKYRLDSADEFSEDRFVILENGSLWLPNVPGGELWYTPMDYCLENHVSEENMHLEDNGTLIHRTEAMLLPLICLQDYGMIDESFRYNLYPIGMLISIVFLVATFLVYLILPELRTLHGKALMNYVGALSVAYSTLSFIQLQSGIVDGMKDDNWCTAIGLLTYYAFMVSFFWLNVMSFDIWWTFSGLGGFHGGLREAERKKFFCYTLYAWGCATLFLGICLMMNFHPDVPPHLSPQFGKVSCWIRAEAEFVYFYAPILLLTVANVALFIATAVKIRGIDKETEVLRREGSTRHTKIDEDKQRFWLYIKLFLVMGVNWMLELLSWAVEGPDWLWIVTDLGNTAQGVFIFLIFVWKPKIRQLLVKRYNGFRGRPTLGRTSHNATTSSMMGHTQVTNFNSSVGTEKSLISRNGNA